MTIQNISVNGHRWEVKISKVFNGFDGHATPELCFAEKVFLESNSPLKTEEKVIKGLRNKIKFLYKNSTYTHPPKQNYGDTCYRCNRQIQENDCIFGIV